MALGTWKVNNEENRELQENSRSWFDAPGLRESWDKLTRKTKYHKPINIEDLSTTPKAAVDLMTKYKSKENSTIFGQPKPVSAEYTDKEHGAGTLSISDQGARFIPTEKNKAHYESQHEKIKVIDSVNETVGLFGLANSFKKQTPKVVSPQTPKPNSSIANLARKNPYERARLISERMRARDTFSSSASGRLGLGNTKTGAVKSARVKPKPLNTMDIGSLAGAQTQIELIRRESLHAIKDVGHHRVFGVLASDPLTGELGKRLKDLSDAGVLTAKNIINAQMLAFNRTALQHKLGPGFELHHGDFTVNVMAEILAKANPSARARALDLQFIERGKTFGDVYRKEGFLSLPKYAHQVGHWNPLTGKVDFAGTQYRAFYQDLNQLSSAEEISDTISKVNTLIERGTQFAADSKTYQNYLKDFTLALPPNKLKEVMGKNFKSISSNPSRKDVIKWQSIWTNLPPEAQKKLKAMADRQLKLDILGELGNNPEYLHYTTELLSHQ